MAQKVEVILGTEDYKKLTGRQARAQNKASFSRVSGIFPNYEKELKVIPLSGVANQIQVGAGAASVDGCVVEILDTTVLEATADGDYVVYLEVDLLADKAHVGIQSAGIELIKEDLTVNKIGTHQYRIASFTMIGGGIDGTSISMDANYLIYNFQDSVWLREQSDNRYERALNINNNYVNEDLAGLNMAQIVNLFSVAMGVSMTTDAGANTIVASSSLTDFSNLHTALNDLLNEFYSVTTNGVLTFRYEAIYGKSTGGGQTLAVTVNNGSTYFFQYDNYGPNYETVNSDAFQATHAYFGSLNTDGMFIRSVDPYFIRGTMATKTVTSGIDMMNVDYSNGVNLFNISRNASSTLTGRQLRIYLRDRAGGVIQQGLEVNGGDTAGVVHRAVDVNKRLAYASEVTRSLQLQRSGLILDIEELQAEEEITPTRATVIAKTLSAKEALLQEVEEELQTLEANMEEAKQNGEQNYFEINERGNDE